MITNSNKRAAWVQHTQIVIEELEYLISEMKDAETGVRGYIITGDIITLEPYYGSIERTFKSFEKIKNLTKDNVEQQQTLTLLKQRIETKQAILIAHIKTKKNSNTFNQDRFNEGKRVMDEARALVNTMQEREKALLQQRSKRWHTLSAITPYMIIFITLVAAIISYYFCANLKRTYYKKIKLQQHLQNQNIKTSQRISIIENVANKIAGGNYNIRLDEEESDVLGTLAISLNQMALSLESSFNEIKALMAKKDDFIGIAAHELKTPLTSIKAYLQFMGRVKFENSDGAKIYPFISKANSQVNRLTEIIKDLLDVSRINENQLGLKLESFTIREAILEAADEIFNSIKTHQLILEGDPDILVEADKFRIEQVLINLISNAIKYSPRADKVIAEIIREGDFVKVSIIDFGIGIPKENLQYVFHRYFRVEVTSQNFSGMGLGLYISKGIIERHGGKIGVISAENKGSTFWFTLPLVHRS
ncbi:MAG: CHASE3 domain-containing protein [Sphingobacteriaceae bacterium]